MYLTLFKLLFTTEYCIFSRSLESVQKIATTHNEKTDIYNLDMHRMEL